MSIAALLTSLRQQGLELWVENGQLHYSAPKDTLTPALRSKLIEHKLEILAALRTNRSTSANGESLDLAPQRPNRERQPFNLDPAELAASRPYTRCVNPYVGLSLARLNLDKLFVRGEGCWLYDSEGHRYLDFIAQYGALPFGYNPPEIWDAIEQLRKDQIPSFVQPSILGKAGELADRLLRVAPAGMRYVTFANSGAEAVEAALKLARSSTGRRGILATRRGYHGKTLGAVSATGSSIYQDAFGAPVAGFHHIPFGDIAALSNALQEHKGYFAAFIVEPIQGEGGIVTPPQGYLTHAQKLCREAGTLLVLDEVQTGLGRTGKLFACDHEQVSPDIIALAKALGGGLMPIGACLCQEEVYNEEFALRHSSTFAGNALACQAALATLDLLEKDDGQLVSQVAENGRKLREELLLLQERHPDLIRSVRGQGYLLGVEFDLSAEVFTHGLFGCLADQGVFTYAISAYLLNMEKIRVAPTESAPGVLRIEPPLVAEWSHCRIFLDALSRAMNVLASRDAARLMAHLIGANLTDVSDLPGTKPHAPRSSGGGIKRGPSKARETDGRFAFLIHLTTPGDYVNLDPSLRKFSDAQIFQLRDRGAGLLAPFRISEVLIESQTGQRAMGEFIAIPYTANELVEMPHEKALAEIGRGVAIARQRGAQVVGLGGFNSVVTLGGIALQGPGVGPLTTGNSYTVVATRRGVEMACRSRDRTLSGSTVAVIGATGAVGRATSFFISQNVGRLILAGNPAHAARSKARLLDVAAGTLLHLWELQTRQHQRFAPDTLGASLVAMSGELPPSPALSDFVKLADEMMRRTDRLSITTDLRGSLPDADVIITATSAVNDLLEAEHLKQSAIVYEVSRPFNAGPELKAARPDVLFVEGGLVRVPSEPDIGWDIGHRQGVVYACIAETMLLALDQRYQDTSLGGNLNIQQINELEALGDKHGFSIE